MVDRDIPRFVARYALDGTGWVASTKKNALQAHGRTLASTRIAMVAAIAAHFDVDTSVVALSDDIEIEPGVDALLKAALEAREAVLAATERSRLATEAAAVAARDAGVSLRDTAHLLGVSHSRVQQILDAADASDKRRSTE